MAAAWRWSVPTCAPAHQSSSRDWNRDGIADELHLSARMPLQPDEVVTGASLTAFVDVTLSVRQAAYWGGGGPERPGQGDGPARPCPPRPAQTATRAHLDALVRVAARAAVPSLSVSLDGDVAFRQRRVEPPRRRRRHRAPPLPPLSPPSTRRAPRQGRRAVRGDGSLRAVRGGAPR